MKAKEIVDKVINFLTDSPFREVEEHENFNELEQMKVIKLFRQTKDYYLTRCINDSEKLAEELAVQSLRDVIKNKQTLNLLYSARRALM